MSKYYIEIKGNKWWRYGVISISGAMFFSNPDLIYKALSKIEFLPLNAEHDLYRNTVTFYGFSPAFKPISRGEKAPTYTLEIDAKSTITQEIENVKVRRVD